MSSTKIKILQFNDVYRVTKQKVAEGEIDVTQFATLLESRRAVQANGEPQPQDSKEGDTLVLFSGDLFSPSVESSVTRGSHMVPIMNALAPDCAVTGNHDFDYGYPHLSNLIKDSEYPWLLSNIIDTDTNKIPEFLKEFEIFERNGVKIGIIGLVEEEWIETVSSWPQNFQYTSMEKVSIELSQKLRDPNGEFKCDIIIALTHSRVPNDIKLAKALHARISPDTAKEHGVDILLGGHDHFYYISKGVSSWDGYDVNSECLGAEEDDGVLVVKSGTDFRDLSELVLELEDAPEGSARKKIIKTLHGKRYTVKPDDPPSESMTKLLQSLLSSISDSLSKPVCISTVELDVHSELVRTRESASGNWFADVTRYAYDDALRLKGVGGADGALICGGTLRGDSSYGPGEITLGNIMEVLPFQDPVVVQEMTGEVIWAALEGALKTWPAQEGRFPIVSGFRVQWDSSKEPGERVVSVCQALQGNQSKDEDDSDDDEEKEPSQKQLDGPPVPRDNSKKYRVVTRNYMAEGHDGYEALKDCKFLIGEEEGKLQSTIVRQYLLGAQYINKIKQLTLNGASEIPFLSHRTNGIVASAQQRHSKGEQKHGVAKWRELVQQKVIKAKSQKQLGDAFGVVGGEHMSVVDCFDGAAMRGGKQTDKSKVQELFKEFSTSDLITISPVVDGRMRNLAQDS